MADGRRRGVSALDIRIFADGADLSDGVWSADLVQGFTTNPTLLRRAGVTDYRAFARRALEAAGARPVSFEVLADDLSEMCRQALEIASWGDHVFVKVPVMNSQGASTAGVIAHLSERGVRLNVTAVMTADQVAQVGPALSRGGLPGSVVSVFAGRIADAGYDPVPHVRRCRAVLRDTCPGAEMLWASTRQVRDLWLAEEAGCEIITMTPDLIAKMALLGKDLEQYSRETVDMFARDALASGLVL